MHIDGRALVRGADQLEMALRHVEAAQRIRAPLAVGRGRARESVDAALGTAHEWAINASRSLQHGGSAVADARIAVDQLAAEIDAVRFRGDVLLARKGEWFRALTDPTRRSGATRSLDDIRWITERESILAAPDARGRAWAAFGEVLAKPDRQIELPDLLRIRRILDLPDGIRPDVPPRMVGNYTLDGIIDSGWLPRHDWESRTVVQELRSRLSMERLREEGARLASDPAVTPASIREQVHRIVAKPDAEVTLDDLRQLALMDELPSRLQPGLPNRANAYTRHQIFERAWLPGRDSEAKKEFAKLRLWSDRIRLVEDPHVTKETLGAALDAMLARSDASITSNDLRRLAVYDGLPQHVRPALPPKASAHTREELYVHASSQSPFDDPDVGAEFATLRQFRAAMLRPRESNTAEALAIIDKPNDQLTRSKAQRLALLDALPAEHRPDIPPTVRALMRDTLTDDIARIALKPDEQITVADLERIAAIDSLPADLRPDLPPPASHADRAMIGTQRSLPSASWHSRVEFASLRRWAMIETETGRTVARQRAAAGELLDTLALESLARGGEETLRSVGMNTDDLLRHSLSALRATSPKDLGALASSLKLLKHVLAEISVTPDTRLAATSATELIDHNIGRIAGNVVDGYGNYPEYADVGRVIEQAELVLALRAATPQRDHVAHATSRAADPLPW